MTQSRPNTLRPKNIKSGLSVTGIWPFNSNIYDENFLPSAVTDCSCEAKEQKITVLEVLTSNSGVSSHSSTSSLSAGPSTAEGNDHHVSPVDFRPFPKAGARKETRNRKSSVLTDTPVKTALESEVRARRKPVKRQMLFGGSQEKSRNCEHLRWGVRRNGSSEEGDDGDCFCIECAEPYSEYRAPTKRFQCIKCHK